MQTLAMHWTCMLESWVEESQRRIGAQGLREHSITICDSFFTSYNLGQELLKRKTTVPPKGGWTTWTKSQCPTGPSEWLHVGHWSSFTTWLIVRLWRICPLDGDLSWVVHVKAVQEAHLSWGAGEGTCGTAYTMEAAHAKDPTCCSYSEGEGFTHYTRAWGKCVSLWEYVVCVLRSAKNIVIIILFFLDCWWWEEAEMPVLQAIWWCQDKHDLCKKCKIHLHKTFSDDMSLMRCVDTCTCFSSTY